MRRYKASGWPYSIICVLLFIFEDILILTDSIRSRPHIFYAGTAMVIYSFAFIAFSRLVAMGKDEASELKDVKTGAIPPRPVSLQRHIAEPTS
jgi:hypothetical protein